MELGLSTYIGLAVLAFACELIDASLGMMYGTLLSPLLIAFGYNPLLVIPSILISQAAGGGVATVRHHKFGSGNFNGLTRDTKIALAVIIPGLAACFLGVLVALSVPGFYLKLYIGIVVVVMGILCIRPRKYGFGWWKISLIGFVSGFNKAFSGGGFGPVTSTGKILGGVSSKVSIATTTYAEVPICLASFVFWIILNGGIDWVFPVILVIGSTIGGFVGPIITHKLKTERLRFLVGVLAVGCGIWLLVRLTT